MASTPPPHPSTRTCPNLSTPISFWTRISSSRTSINSSFSFGPQSLVNSFVGANPSLPHPLALDPNRSVLPSSPRAPRRAKGSLGRHPLANDNTDVFQVSGDEDDEDVEWGMIDRMRLWRHDALMQHLYDTAAFWGDKILSWTNDPNDAFWLAQTYFMIHRYSRAERLLTRPFSTKSPAVPFDLKGKAREPAFTPRLPGVSRLVDMSVVCRYLAAQCLVRQGKWAEATEMLGEANPFRNSGRSGPAVPNTDGGSRWVEASMCNLRGLLMLKLNRGDQAKASFMEALALDVKCYDAFEQLVGGEMMTLEEEWEFIQSLAYKEQTPEDAELVRLLYTSRLRKYKHAEEHAHTRKRLVQEFGLSDNPDVLFSFADALYTQFRWSDCYTITSRILGLVAVHTPTLPLHIACMHHLPHLHSKLFILAHELVDREPEAATSWYAVGVWYLTQKKWSEARTYFSKTSLMDPRFGPAWIAFAHTFASEGEHDHAVTAYSTCARMFAGSHLPLMFIGMEHIVLSNYGQADEALDAADAMCDGDPLLINERGVMAFNHGRFTDAVVMFESALQIAQVTQTSQASWATTWLNLGTSLRKLGKLSEAREAYIKVLEIDSRSAPALGFLGLVYHLMDKLDDAIVKYHEALSINSINPHVLELLNLALEASADAGPFVRLGGAGRSEEWTGQMRAYAAREAQFKALRATREKEKETESSLSAVFGDAQETEAGMALG
ncbi:hypothetical protein BC826DRAFT_990349 [Russula brevipes]|nr:hypothetical protein BC826DRAFT_990349 [Russula brevipes]